MWETSDELKESSTTCLQMSLPNVVATYGIAIVVTHNRLPEKGHGYFKFNQPLLLMRNIAKH